MDVQTYFAAVKEKLLLCAKIASIDIVDEKVSLQNRGYLRVRLRLINGDFIETSEYVVADGDQLRTLKYRHQWMDESQIRLIKRWDNVPHFSQISSFPDHVHIGDEENVSASEPLSILDLIGIMEKDIDN
jgi:hypothetical protein